MAWTSFFSREAAKESAYENEKLLLEEVDYCFWTVTSVKKKSCGDESFTAFTLDARRGDLSNQLLLARSCLKRLKTLRHPNVLAYVDSSETHDSVQIITQQAVPLSVYLKRPEFNENFKDSIVSWGLFQLMTAIQFLVNDAKLIHNNVNIHSIFVTPGADWKLGGFEFVLQQDSSTECIKSRSLSKYDPPEGADSRAVKNRPWYNNRRVFVDVSILVLVHHMQAFARCTDIWGTACLIWEIYNPSPLLKSSDLKTMQKIPKRFHSLYSRLIESPEKRPSPEDILLAEQKSGGIFKNAFIDAMRFLSEIQIKTAEEKANFFDKLSDSIFSDDIKTKKILPHLVAVAEGSHASSNVLSLLFKFSKLIDASLYQKLIVPCIVQLFASNDRGVRVKLLQQIEEILEHLQPALVNSKIFPCIVSGFTDTNPAVREATVKSMVNIAPKLNYNNLNVELMKHLACLQGRDDQNIIRTNSTVCLGKIASYLSPQSRQKILVSAFTRALRDPFAPARISGILAIVGTQQFYHLSEVANRILPALASATVDPERSVREQAFKAIKGFLAKLEKASESPELVAEMEAQVMAASGGNVLISNVSVPSWAQWAIGALSSKFYKATPALAESSAQIEAKNLTEVSQSELSVTSSRAPGIQSSENASKAEKVVERLELPLADSTPIDGWDSFVDDDDDAAWGDIDIQPTSVPSANRSVHTDASSSTSPKPSLTKSPAQMNTHNAEPDDDWSSSLTGEPALPTASKTLRTRSTATPAQQQIGGDDWNWKSDTDDPFSIRNNVKQTSREQKSGPLKLGAKKLNDD